MDLLRESTADCMGPLRAFTLHVIRQTCFILALTGLTQSPIHRFMFAAPRFSSVSPAGRWWKLLGLSIRRKMPSSCASKLRRNRTTERLVVDASSLNAKANDGGTTLITSTWVPGGS